MANTERMAALQTVREAKNAVMAARMTQGASAADQATLTELYFELEDLEDSLILDWNEASLERINNDARGLTDLVAKMQGSAAHLQQLAATIKKVSDVVGVVVDVATKALTLVPH
jgi:hypothetical protein